MHADRFAVPSPSCARSRWQPAAWRSGLAAVGVAALLTLGACASLQTANLDLPTVGRVTLGLPAGDWVHVAHGSELLQVAGEGPQQLALRSRAVALRGSHGEVQAVVLVLSNVDNNPTHVTQWDQACASGDDLRVDDGAKDSPERVDCLRSKSRALVGGWLDKREPAVMNWLEANKVPLPNQATWVSHQFANRAGMYLSVHVLADSRLLEPRTHDNDSFLRAGYPLVVWSRDLAKAVRVSTGLVDGRLDIPAFPFPQPVDLLPQAVPVAHAAQPAPTASAPAQAVSDAAPAASAPAPAASVAAPAPERARKADRE